ncbi:sugar MFS transporter [Dyadobacter bucti]|uniref:sugar MFS transporter n=1 Tax=Dyadobacter bucti TaxID=2572203 RepID=UPI00110836C4|nr:sugar MFS transporter [Dyadobacter bucti]
MAQIPVSQIATSENPGAARNYLPALLSLAALYFMMGFITCLNDTLVPFFKNGFHLTYTRSALVQFYFFLTYGIMSVPAGRIVEKTGYKRGMVTGFLVASGGAFLFFPASVMHEYYLFLAALFILAIGIVILQVAANPYITILGPADTASSRFTLIQGVGSIGTTVAPIFGTWFILSPLGNSEASSDAVRLPYLGIAALLILIAWVVNSLRLPEIKPVGDVEKVEENRKIFSFRNLKLGVWALFFYVGAEVAIGSFLTNYIADTLSVSEQSANSYVAFYWGSMLVGRLAGSVLLKSVRPPLVLAFCAVAAMVLIGISIGTSGYLAVWTMIGVGLFNSVMFATIFSLSVNGLGKFTTQASGLLSTAIVGGAIISYGQGWLIDRFTWQVAFTLPLLCYLYIVFYGLDGYKTKPILNS